MIRLAPALCLVLCSAAACSPKPAANNSAAAAPQPQPAGPPPMTPTTNVTAGPGKSPTWLGPRSAPDAPQTAPYGNLLDQPVVNGTGAR